MSTHPIRQRRLRLGGALIAMVLLSLDVSACAGSWRSTSDLQAKPQLFFENATPDAVSVYVDDQESQWLLGHVEPGRSARLRLPQFLVTPRTSDVRLVVVPVGSHRDAGRAPLIEGAIRSDLEPLEHLRTMRWMLRGTTLIAATPLPRR